MEVVRRIVGVLVDDACSVGQRGFGIYAAGVIAIGITIHQLSIVLRQSLGSRLVYVTVRGMSLLVGKERVT